MDANLAVMLIVLIASLSIVAMFGAVLILEARDD